MSAFFVAGISIALFIEFLLVSKKHKSDADLVLAAWMFVILLHLFLFFIWFTGVAYDYPFLLGVEHPLPLLHGVFLFLYVSFVTGRLPGKRKLLLLHFLPAGLMYAYLASFFILPVEQKVWVYRNQGAGYEVFMVIRLYAVSCSGVFYVIWSALLLRKHTNAIRDRFSNLEKVSLQWLRILTYGLGVIWCLVLFGNETLIFTGVVVFVFLIGFFGVRQGEIFAHGPPPSADMEPREKYQKSGLSEEALWELHVKLKHLMTEEALYKQSDLSIDVLAEKLDVHPNYLSQVINQKEGKHFFDFVNSYRIDEFKRLIAMQKNRQFTLLAMAYDCGFSSKTSFNRSFKKATGQTPSQYAAALPQPQV